MHITVNMHIAVELVAAKGIGVMYKLQTSIVIMYILLFTSSL